ncbi:g4732 [Coccomyxa elongata]
MNPPTNVCPYGSYLIVHNVSKRHNIGTLVRSAAAFGVTEVCLVGARQFNTFGSHGSADYVKYRHFPSLQECCRYLKEDRGCRVMGVEITEDAQPIQAHPFSGPTAFMLGNEGSGLSPQQAQLCNAFVYIPQYGAGTASLNVTVAASIVLQHFAVWAGYPERPRTGEKFEIGERPQRTGPRGMVPLTEEEWAAERERRQDRRAASNWHSELQDSEGLLDPFLERADAEVG